MNGYVNKRLPVKMWFGALSLCLGVQMAAGLVPDYVRVLYAMNDGGRMPVVALGTGRGTAAGAPVEEVRQAVYWAIESGYEHIDTAAIYQNEKEVGLGIADAINKGLIPRDQLFVTTKLWNDRHGEEEVVPALCESLERLGLDYVDLYLINFPISLNADGTPSNIDYLETWKGMEEAKKLGLTKSIGVSNFNKTQIDRLYENSEIKPSTNQIEVNPTLTQEDLVKHCQKLRIAVMAHSPFGYMVTRNSKDMPPPRIDDPTLKTIGDRYGKSTSQVVLRYLLDRGIIITPKSTNKQHIAENIDVFDFVDFRLNSEEVERISRFNINKRVIEPLQWKDYPNYPF